MPALGLLHVVADPDGGASPLRNRVLFLSGTAGTGKRTVAAFMAFTHSACHVDLDSGPLRRQRLRAALAHRDAERGMIVTSADPCPSDCLDLLWEVDFEWIWFDIDRGAARPDGLDLIGPGGRWIAIAAPRFVDPFRPDGSFRCLEQIAAEL